MPRTPSEPTPEAVLEKMEPGEPYTVADFEDVFDVSRWTIRRRLQTLHEEGAIHRKKHSENLVTWWIPTDTDGEE